MKQTEIRATENHSKKTYTLRCFYDGKYYAKYRTHKLSSEEFNSCLHHTQNDWRNFLKYDDYYKVQKKRTCNSI